MPPLVNLMENHSFETGDLADWIVWGEGDVVADIIKSDDAFDGEYMLHLAYDNTDWYGVHQDGIDVEPDKYYTLTFKYKMDETSTAPCAYIYIHGLDKDGVGSGDGSLNDTVIYSSFAQPVEDWSVFTTQFKTFAGTKLSVDIRVVNGLDMYIDDVQLTEVR